MRQVQPIHGLLQRQSGMISCGSCGAPLETHAVSAFAAVRLSRALPKVGTSNSENSKSQPDVALPQAQVVRRVVRHGNSSQPLPSTAAEPPSLASATKVMLCQRKGLLRPSRHLRIRRRTLRPVQVAKPVPPSTCLHGNCGRYFKCHPLIKGLSTSHGIFVCR